MSESGFLLGVWKHFLARYHQSIKVNHNSRHDTELIMHKITIKFIQKKRMLVQRKIIQFIRT